MLRRTEGGRATGTPSARSTKCGTSGYGPDESFYKVCADDGNLYILGHQAAADMTPYRRQEMSAQILDFKCVEFVEELLYGPHRKHPFSK
jgi:hypothetical protein